jgi:hypothetical protein
MTELYYNFNKIAKIPQELYEKVWNCEKLFQNKALMKELNETIGEIVYEIHRTESF